MSEPQAIKLSLIIPVYNRPTEVDELLESLTLQTNPHFEVVIVEDGSSVKCDEQVKKFAPSLDVKYFFKPNSGPGTSRNYGAERSLGNYVIFLDSDCVIPQHYIQTVYDKLNTEFVDAFGGPDMASDKFTTLQKAINYAMTSFLTTGGIRGGSEKLDKFHPRSFNMGYSKAVFERTQGFSTMRFGEDIDMSIRIISNGFKTALFKEAYVYHKRRTNLRQFFKQVFNSGIARINLYKRHPKSLKLVHFLPSVFTVGAFFSIILGLLVSPYLLLPLAIYTLILFIDATIQNKSFYIGLKAIIASYCQLMGYGSGFLIAFTKRILLSKKEFSAFTKTFYE